MYIYIAYSVPNVCCVQYEATVLQSDTHSKTENILNKHKFDNELILNVFHETRTNFLKSLNSFLLETKRVIQNENYFSVN